MNYIILIIKLIFLYLVFIYLNHINPKRISNYTLFDYIETSLIILISFYTIKTCPLPTTHEMKRRPEQCPRNGTAQDRARRKSTPALFQEGYFIILLFSFILYAPDKVEEKH